MEFSAIQQDPSWEDELRQSFPRPEPNYRRVTLWPTSQRHCCEDTCRVRDPVNLEPCALCGHDTCPGHAGVIYPEGRPVIVCKHCPPGGQPEGPLFGTILGVGHVIPGGNSATSAPWATMPPPPVPMSRRPPLPVQSSAAGSPPPVSSGEVRLGGNRVSLTPPSSPFGPFAVSLATILAFGPSDHTGEHDGATAPTPTHVPSPTAACPVLGCGSAFPSFLW